MNQPKKQASQPCDGVWVLMLFCREILDTEELIKVGGYQQARGCVYPWFGDGMGHVLLLSIKPT
jgi:hypothetical protein